MGDVALAPGVWGVLATPFHGPALEVDRDSLTRLAGHLESAGATGLTVLGVFGEAARLSVAERRAVLGAVVDAVSLPLVVGATSLATAPLLDEVRMAQEVAGDRLAAVMVQVHSPSADVLRAHLQAVHDATGAAVVVQDYPVASGVRIGGDDLVRALTGLSFVAAVKAESPPTAAAVAGLTARLDVPVFGGLGGLGLLDELAVGAAGAMTGFSFPEGLVACTRAFATDGFAAAREAFLPHLPLIAFEQQPGIGLAIRKECLRRRGLVAEAAVRPPSPPMPAALRDQLVRQVDALAVPAGVR
ncbi:dihydrodipicolinate synthase family protein [Modestobacter sp. VKM Ac-2979]|uniref:dihydrodipicolinate synthase family protein n=1 Tax=unclassified Modestobacter TaxID=2643866 RepID=UPI0022AB9EDD|nr:MULTISPECIES: dihydrodipicolinate synthase family protein [unclassified Modestobacter]MCZ2814318.1 dihydrodipicolinate synthase family protein [Modestobacter sp. VKM Ac-2979]MCZ2843990.1 dihydrodipicolinate synthase family protein [Modestobacter sp. VKM Ac-2980]